MSDTNEREVEVNTEEAAKKFAGLLVILQKELADLNSAISLVQLYGMQHKEEDKPLSSIHLINQLGRTIVSSYLVSRSLGLSDSDMKELSEVSLEVLKNVYPQIIQVQKLDS